MAVRVKICGITNSQDADYAMQCGADYLGLIFVESSPRHVRPDQARRIAALRTRPPRTQLVGVFKDASLETIEQATHEYGLDLVQLHGSETPEFCGQIALPVIKVLEIEGAYSLARSASLLSAAAGYGTVAKYFLFDRPKSRKEDPTWLVGAIASLSEITVPLPYFFAGGLTVDNLESALAALEPFGVDVASGVETVPGKKDPVQVNKFLQCVRAQEVKSGHASLSAEKAPGHPAGGASFEEAVPMPAEANTWDGAAEPHSESDPGEPHPSSAAGDSQSESAPPSDRACCLSSALRRGVRKTSGNLRVFLDKIEPVYSVQGFEEDPAKSLAEVKVGRAISGLPAALGAPEVRSLSESFKAADGESCEHGLGV